MPIIVHFGNVRQGKSYAAVRDRICPALAEGRHVVTNIEGMGSDGARERMAAYLKRKYGYEGQIRLDAVGHSELQRSKVFPENLHREDEDGTRLFDDSESLVKFGSLIVWDEASMFSTKQLPSQWHEAITYHGHWARDGRCVDMVLVHQHWDSLAPIIRASSELVFEFVKRASGKKYDRFKFQSPGDRKITRGAKDVLKETFAYEKEVFDLYKTNADTSGEVNDGVAEKFTDSEFYKKRKRMMIALLIGSFIWLGGFGYFYLKPKYIDAGDAAEKPFAPGQTGPAGNVVGAVVQAEESAKIVGQIPTQNGLVAVVEDRGRFVFVEAPSGRVKYQGRFLEWPQGF